MSQPREGLRSVAPYVSPQLDVPVRLNTNECPYPLPSGFAEDLAERVRAIGLNRYPDRDAVELRRRLGQKTGHDSDEVWVGNGSNEVILQLLHAYGGPGRRALVFEPTYQLHRRIPWITQTEVETIDLDPPYVIGPDAMARAAERDAAVIFVCSPNNPTGGAQPPEVAEALARSDAVVIVDEAYIEFGGMSAAGLVRSHPNVVVVRTFSKAFSLAGARIGYCLAPADVVEDLRRVALPYHLSALTQAAGLAALDHEEEAMAILDAIRAQRDRLLEGLALLAGVEVFPSDANFVLFRPPRPAAETWQALLDRGVLVRDLSEVVPGCLRVTAGTEEEVHAFLQALTEVLR